MSSLAIIGSQWGDEGKGKITDLLGAHCDCVVRYQGGNNAGHTIIVGKKKIVLHLIPSGILHDHCLSLVGHGVVFDPGAFQQELDSVRQAGIEVTPKKLMVSQNASVITAYNKILDAAREQKGEVKIGTTGKGIGPAYEDKVGRIAIKVKDLLDPVQLKKKLAANLKEKEILFTKLYNCEFPTLEQEHQRLVELGQIVKPFVGDTFNQIDELVQKKKTILFEGAQGVLLDIDYGSYPYVTSSNTSFGGIYSGAGLPGHQIDEVIGITKCYTTRVGEGPFPTELHNSLGELIQQKGGEFGATTGRKRRCGWLDLPLLKYSVKCSNISSLALTKLDILSGLDELKVCTAYRYQGKEITCAYPGIDLSKAEPIYQDFKPFTDDFSGELSTELKNYLKAIESFLNVSIGIIAHGPERSEVRFLKKYF